MPEPAPDHSGGSTDVTRRSQTSLTDTSDEKKETPFSTENAPASRLEPTTSRPGTTEKSLAGQRNEEVVDPEKRVSTSSRKLAEDGEAIEEVEDESKYLSGFKLGILSLGLCLVSSDQSYSVDV